MAREMMDFVNQVRTETDTSFHERDPDSPTIVRETDEFALTVRHAASRLSILKPAKDIERNVETALDENQALAETARYRERDSGFTLESAWEGMVEEVTADSFTARVTPVGNGETEYLVTLSKDDLDDLDRDRLEPGALFYWNLGRDMSQRPRRKVSEIWLRRIDLSSIPPADSEAVESFKALFADD